MTQLRIHTILTHRDPDIDEIVAIHLLKRHGELKYPGISKANIVTIAQRNTEGKSAEEMEREGVLCIGVGRGRFDEHPSENRARVEGECAATLVAKDLSMRDDQVAKSNIEYALEKNYSANTWEFEIAPLEKLAFRYLAHTGEDKNMEQKIFDACFLLLDVAERNESHHPEERKANMALESMDEFIARWILERFGGKGNIADYLSRSNTEDKSASVIVAKDLKKADDKVFYWILQYAKKRRVADDGEIETKYDLSELVKLAQRYDFNQDRLEEAVFIFLDAIWHKYKNFFIDCRRDYNSRETRVAEIVLNEETLVVTSVLSSNPEIAKYCRSQYGGNSAVVIKRDPDTGNTQIFFNQKFNLDPIPVAREIRRAERQAKGLEDNLGDEELGKQGKVQGSEEWFFDGFQVLNGSHTAEEKPTVLKREEVEKAVLRGLMSR